MSAGASVWLEAAVAALLVLSGVFVVVSALGFVRLQDFFLRMHPPALAYTFGSWCAALASVLSFSMLEARPRLHPWLIIVVLSLTVPLTTLLLARVALFRRRVAGAPDTPPPLSAPRSAASQPNGSIEAGAEPSGARSPTLPA